MKRLIKKAELIELEHGTTLDTFILICKDGALKPQMETSNNNGVGAIGDGGDVMHPDGIYLGYDNPEGYAYSAAFSDSHGVGVLLRMQVDSKNLRPAMDNMWEEEEEEDEDGNIIYNIDDKIYTNDTLTWKQTFDLRDECICIKNIPTSNITDVMFFNKYENKDSIDIPFVEHMSFNEAKEIIDKII